MRLALDSFLSLLLAFSVHTAGIYRQSIFHIDEHLLAINVSLGTPPQPFSFVIDNSNAQIWVRDISCINPICTQKKPFVSNASNTYQYDGRFYGTNQVNVESPKAFSGTLQGFTGNDTFQLGTDLSIVNETFGQATNLNYEFGGPFDGILGLAFTSKDTMIGGKILPPFQSAIAQGLLAQPLFTVALTAQGGDITWGGEDPQSCGPVTYVPLSAAGYWQFKVARVSMATYSSTQNWDAAVAWLVSAFGGNYVTPQIMSQLASISGAVHDPELSLYDIDCDAEVPDIVFTVGSTQFVFDRNFSVVKDDDGSCYFAFKDFQSSGFGPQLYFSHRFYEVYCVSHDMGAQRVGFASNLRAGNLIL